ncbi:phosphotransferase family protein [Streptomyces sp. NPDC058657]|uniref:phosphotransferase family protein n=1 Tax=unclassified Streptomyces TaxID=2593676 RepID=UPI00364764F1
MVSAPRPRTTTRDPEELGRRLTRWLGARLPGARVSHIRVPDSNGMSSETLLFDLDHPEAPVTGCALRLAADPAAYTVFPVYDMARQHRVMRLVGEYTDVPVPRVLWLEEDAGALGAPFFVMARAEGRVPPDVMPYTYEGNWLHSATDTERAALEAASIGVLARLHSQFPAKEAEFLLSEVSGGPEDPERPESPEGPDGPQGASSPLGRHIEAQRSFYEWVVDGLPRSPLIEEAFDLLDTRRPQEEGEPVLCWGDARIGNIVYDGFEPAAVLDWEMAAYGPRELDLGWTVYLHRFFQDLTESFGQAGLPDFLRRDAIEER